MSEKETNGRHTSFLKKWLEDPELNIWLSEVKGDTKSGKCTICKSALKDKCLKSRK